MESETWFRILLAAILPFLLVQIGRAAWLGRWKVGGETYPRSSRPGFFWTVLALHALAALVVVAVIAWPGEFPRNLFMLGAALLALGATLLDRDQWFGQTAPSQRRAGFLAWTAFGAALILATLALLIWEGV